MLLALRPAIVFFCPQLFNCREQLAGTFVPTRPIINHPERRVMHNLPQQTSPPRKRPPQKLPMRNVFPPLQSVFAKKCTLLRPTAAGIVFLLLPFVFSGCSATGPFEPHTAFKQAVLPSGYQSVQQQGSWQNQEGYRYAPQALPQWQSANYPPAYGQQYAPGTALPYVTGAPSGQYSGGYGVPAPVWGQSTIPQRNRSFGRGLTSPFVGGGNFTSGRC